MKKLAKSNSVTLTPRHLKAARALMGCNAEEFSRACNVSVATIRNFESGKKIKERSQKAIFDGLRHNGITMKGGKIMSVTFDSTRGKWGINLKAVVCPKCSQKAPPIRKPQNINQALWGGWTCSNCGCEMDKFGKEINRL